MKYLSKIILSTICMATFLAACDKADLVPFYKNGAAVVLNSTTSTIATNASDTSSTVVTFSWTNPQYSTDSAHQKFIVELDSTGKNFVNEVTYEVDGPLNTSFTGSKWTTALSKLGLSPGAPSSVDVRVTSSYANNNEQYKSNVVTIKTTPFILPITLTPSSTNPLALLITNASNTAVSFSWTPSEYGVDTFSYALQFDTAGGSFANPQVVQYSSQLAGSFTVGNLNTSAILAGISAGTTKTLEFRIVGFLNGNPSLPSVFSNVDTITVTTYLPFLYLYIAGAYEGWSPGTAPSIAATVPNLTYYEGYVNVPSPFNDGFKITSAPDWNHTNYGDPTGNSGTLSSSGGNISWPSGSAYYYVTANLTSNTWTATPTTWSIIGDATPGGWGSDTQLTYDPVNNVWVLNGVALTAGTTSLKFRANDDWGINLGGNLTGLSYGGSNISVSTAGNYNIVLDLSHPLKYTATFTLQ